MLSPLQRGFWPRGMWVLRRAGPKEGLGADGLEGELRKHKLRSGVSEMGRTPWGWHSWKCQRSSGKPEDHPLVRRELGRGPAHRPALAEKALRWAPKAARGKGAVRATAAWPERVGRNPSDEGTSSARFRRERPNTLHISDQRSSHSVTPRLGPGCEGTASVCLLRSCSDQLPGQGVWREPAGRRRRMRCLLASCSCQHPPETASSLPPASAVSSAQPSTGGWDACSELSAPLLGSSSRAP